MTPGGRRPEGVEVDPGSGALLLRLRRDEDGDGEVGTLDPVRTWVLDRGPDGRFAAEARPLIDPALAERIEQLLR